MALSDILNPRNDIPGLDPAMSEWLQNQKNQAMAAALLTSNRGFSGAMGEGIGASNNTGITGLSGLIHANQLQTSADARKRQMAYEQRVGQIPTTETTIAPQPWMTGNESDLPKIAGEMSAQNPQAFNEYFPQKNQPRDLSSVLQDYARASMETGMVPPKEIPDFIKALQPKEGKSFDMNNQYDAFLAQSRGLHGYDITDPNQYRKAINWMASPNGKEAWQDWLKTNQKDFKRSNMYQTGIMNGKNYAIQPNPNNEQLEYFDPESKAWKTVPGNMIFTNQMLTPTQAQMLGVPYGTTIGGAAKEDISPLTAGERDKLNQFNAAIETVKQIEKYANKVNTFGTGAFGEDRIIGGLSNYAGSLTQTNPEAAMLETKRGALSNIIRGMGERGALAEGDVKRGIDLIPNLSDTKEVKDRKIKDLYDFFNEVKRQTQETYTTPIKKTAPVKSGSKFKILKVE